MIIKNTNIEVVQFNGISDIDSIQIFTNPNRLSYGQDFSGKYFLGLGINNPSYKYFHVSLGNYIAKIGEKIIILTKEEFESL